MTELRSSIRITTMLAFAALAGCSSPAPGAIGSGNGTQTDALGVTLGDVIYLVGVQSGRCMSVAGDSTADQAALELRDCSGAPSQQLRLEAADGYYALRVVGSERCLAVSGASTSAGASIVQATCSGAASQQWSGADVGGAYRITSPASGMAIDAYGAGTANGTKIIQWPENGGVNQQWSVVSASDLASYNVTIATSGSGTTSPAPGTYTVQAGTTGSVTATPASGYTFTGWSGAAMGTANPLIVTVTGNMTLTANFATNGGGRIFVHPGLLHTNADFQRMAAKVAANESPWREGYQVLASSGYASASWTPRPLATVIRGGTGENYAQLYKDITAAYANAIRWKATGDTAHADAAVRILDAWSSTLTTITGNADRYLAAGIYGYQFANVAEILRTYPGWSAAGLARFQAMMLNVFYPLSHEFLLRHNGACISNYWANWDLCNLANMLAIGVLCDREDIYQEAIDYYTRTGQGNGALAQAVYYLHPGHLGQWQEVGRDQGHASLSIMLVGVLCEMAWNQGDDLYGFDDNRVLAAAEYVARWNLDLLDDAGNAVAPTMPWVTYGPNCGQGVQTSIATAGRPHGRPLWELFYNHYVNRKGLAAPNVAQKAAQLRPEGVTTGDQFGLGTLTFSRDPIAKGAVPSGLTAVLTGGKVVLSWWGSAYATAYKVKRATQSGGPYTTIATVPAQRFDAARPHAPPAFADTMYTDGNVTVGGTYRYVVSAISSSGESADSQEAVAEVGLRARARLAFDEGSGATAADNTGDGWNGALAGGASWSSGWSGSALSLNGSGAYLSLPEGVVGDLSDFTLAAWVYLESLPAHARVFDFGTGTLHYLMLEILDGHPRLAATVVGYQGEESILGADRLPTGAWSHVAVTLSGTEATLYVNGAPVGKNTAFALAPFQVGSTTQNWIGRSQYTADPNLAGRVDDLRIYSGAMSAQEVAALAAP